jgi:hypothetical protein
VHKRQQNESLGKLIYPNLPPTWPPNRRTAH